MAVDMFLKLDGIKGESTDDFHKGEIDIESFSFGMSQVGSHSGVGGGSGKVSVHDISISASVNLSSPQLALACASGKHIPSGLITCRKAGGKADNSSAVEFLIIKMNDVLISGYSLGSKPLDSGFSSLPEGDNDVPTDQISLNFAKVSLLYTSPRDPAVTGSTGVNGIRAVTSN